MNKLTFLLLCFCLVSSGLSQVIEVEDRVEVSGDTLVLGDIAQIGNRFAILSEIPIGYAPYPGHYRWLGKADLERLLRRFGADMAQISLKMADRVLITRASQTLSRELIRDHVESFLHSKAPNLQLSIKRIDLPKEIILPKGQPDINVSLSGELRNLEHVTLKLNLSVDGRHQKSQWVRVILSARSAVLVATRDLPYGHRLGSSDVRVEEKELRHLNGAISESSQVVGQVTKRPLKTGDTLTSRDLKQPVLVRRGEAITLTARGHNFVVSTTGKARSQGAMGDYIEVENMNSRQRVYGFVTGNRSVEVKLPEAVR